MLFVFHITVLEGGYKTPASQVLNVMQFFPVQQILQQRANHGIMSETYKHA